MGEITIAGPFVRVEDNTFDFNATGSNGAVIGLNLGTGDIVDSIEVLWEGNVTQKAGGSGGSISKVRLENGEHFTDVLGSYGEYYGHKVICTIVFATNKGRLYGPFGNPAQTHIEKSQNFSAKGGKLIGIFGKEGSAYVSSLGFYFES